MYQRLGLIHSYATDDLGRYELTGADADRYVFKVPSLRNVAETAPYFHNGQVETLEEAVRLMAYPQLGRELCESESEAIIAFLGSLTGTVDTAYIALPELPPNGPTTPPPNPS